MNNVNISVSKGVFVHEGKKKQLHAVDYFNENDRKDDKRYSISNGIWETINNRVQVLQSDSNTQIVENLVKFIKTAYEGGVMKEEIPTAALITGVNSPDHAIMFSNLQSIFNDRLTPFVIKLRAKECISLKSMVSKVISEVMGASDLVDDSDEEEEEEDKPNVKKVMAWLAILSQWYQDKFQERCTISPRKKAHSPRKRKANSQVNSDSVKEKPPVVLILEDLEEFVPSVLQNFIIICSDYVPALPVVMVFGIATSVTAVHKMLSNSATRRLCMEKFQAPPSSQYLTSVIDQVIMTDDIAFKLGPKVFNFLLDMFLFHNFSVIGFVRGIQFAVVDHFYSNEYSIVCDEVSEAQDTIAKMTERQLRSLQDLQSYQDFLAERSTKESPIATKKDVAKVLNKMVCDLNVYHNCYFPVLRCLHAFAAKLPRYPLGKQVRELYARSISSYICDTKEYQEAIALMKSLSRDDLLQLLDECYNNLESATQEFRDVREKLQYYYEQFKNIEELQRKADEERDTVVSEETALPVKTNLYNLKQKLRSMEMNKKKVSVYESLRTELIDYLHTLFKSYLKSPASQSLHEVFYYNDVASLRCHISGSPRSTIQWGLMDPHHYLQNESLKSDDDMISSSLPDICIVYKLHLECGRLINLYDWLQAFIAIVSVERDYSSPRKTPRKTPKKAQQQPDKRVLQARFIRAVSELQFLGFIKPTQRKTDHVARLTWGGC